MRALLDRSTRSLARLRIRRAWWATFLAFAALGCLWALASPLYSVPDEGAHTLRAVSASRGDVLPTERTDKGYSTIVEVPEVFGYQGMACFAFKPDVTADCAPPFRAPDRPALYETTAGLYPPAFYTVVGLPSLPFPSATGLYLMRMLHAGLCAALVASAVLSVRALRSPAPHLLLAGVALAVTPEALFLFGSVNPSGLEIAGAVCLWASLAALVTLPREAVSGRLLLRIGFAGSALAVARPGSPLWLVLVALVVAVWAGRHRLAPLVADRTVWLSGSAVGLAGLSTVLWVRHYGTLATTLGRNPGHGVQESARIGLGYTTEYVQQMIGVFGWLDTGPATLSVYLWLVGLGALVVLAVATAGRRDGLVLLGLVAAVVLVPVALQAPRAAEQGFPWQGRYTLPLAVGIPVLAAFQIERARRLSIQVTRRISVVLLALFAVGQLYGHVWATRRYTAGVDGRVNWIAADGWSPPLPTGLLFALFVVTLGATAACLLRLADGALDDPVEVEVEVEAAAPAAAVERPRVVVPVGIK